MQAPALLLVVLLLACAVDGRTFPSRSPRPGLAPSVPSESDEPPVETTRRFPVTVVLEAPNACALRRFPVVRNFIETKARYYPTLAVRHNGADPRFVFLEGQRVRSMERVDRLPTLADVEAVLDRNGVVAYSADAAAAGAHYDGFVREAGPGFSVLRPAEWTRRPNAGSAEDSDSPTKVAPMFPGGDWSSKWGDPSDADVTMTIASVSLGGGGDSWDTVAALGSLESLGEMLASSLGKRDGLRAAFESIDPVDMWARARPGMEQGDRRGLVYSYQYRLDGKDGRHRVLLAAAAVAPGRPQMVKNGKAPAGAGAPAVEGSQLIVLSLALGGEGDGGGADDLPGAITPEQARRVVRLFHVLDSFNVVDLGQGADNTAEATTVSAEGRARDVPGG